MTIYKITLCVYFILYLADGAVAQSNQTSRVLTFEEAVQLAPNASKKGKMADAELDARRSEHNEALSGLGPKVRATYTQAQFDRAVTVPLGPDAITLRPDEVRQGGLELTQPISGIFTAYKASEVAKAYEQASAANSDFTKISAAFEAASAYIEAQEADELVKLAESSIAAADAQMRDADILSKSGRITQSDLLKIGIAAQEAKAQLARMNARQKKAKQRLLYLVGFTPDTNILLQPLPKTNEAVKSADAVNLPREAEGWKTRVDLKKASLELEAANYEATLSHMKFAPNVNAFVKLDRVYSEPSFGNPPFTRTYGLSVSWDIWDNGARIFASSEAAARIRKASSSLQEAEELARLEVEGLTADLSASREALNAAKAAVDQAEEAYRLDKARFSSGLVTTTDLLLSEATRTKAWGVFVDTLAQLNRLSLSLQKALGSIHPKMLSQ